MAQVCEQPSTTICSHCNRDIPSSNIDLHSAHCSRNLEKCKICDEMVPRIYAEEHFSSTHAPVSCSLCSQTMDRDLLAVHRGENCPQRIMICKFCEFPLPSVDLFEHQEVCGNRTELCDTCSKYIRLRERSNHEIRCIGVARIPAEPSRNTRETERREPGPQRRKPAEFSPKHLILSVAITGIAVLLGSLFFQKKPESPKQ